MLYYRSSTAAAAAAAAGAYVRVVWRGVAVVVMKKQADVM